MSQFFPSLTPELRAFIARQQMFFTASAAPEGRINLSPKGLGALRVLSDSAVAYLDLTGSGAETAAHIKHDGRLTIMMCAFEGEALILRLYGRGESLPRGSAPYADLLAAHFGNEEQPGARQIVVLHIESAQTSCGYGVPLYQLDRDRTPLLRWAEAKGEAGLDEYRREKNAVSIDGLETGLVK